MSIIVPALLLAADPTARMRSPEGREKEEPVLRRRAPLELALLAPVRSATLPLGPLKD